MKTFEDFYPEEDLQNKVAEQLRNNNKTNRELQAEVLNKEEELLNNLTSNESKESK